MKIALCVAFGFVVGLVIGDFIDKVGKRWK